MIFKKLVTFFKRETNKTIDKTGLINKNSIVIKKYALEPVLVMSIASINKKISEITTENSDIISARYEDKLIKIEHIDPASPFKFHLIDVKFNEIYKSQAEFFVEYSPYAEDALLRIISDRREEYIIDLFTSWIDLVRKVHTTNLIPEDAIFSKSKQEIYDDFKIIDEDAGTTPFSIEQQLLLDRYLEHITEKVKSSNDNSPNSKEFVRDISELRNSLGKLSKREIIEKLSSNFAKLRAHSVKLFGEVYSVAKKESIKKGIYALIEIGKDLI